MGLTHPALGQELKLTFMDYLLTMLRNLLRRKLSCDNCPRRREWGRGGGLTGGFIGTDYRAHMTAPFVWL